VTERILPFARKGFDSGRRAIREIGTSMLEEPIVSDRSSIVLPEEMRNERLDWALLLATLALFGLGMLMVLSSTSFVAQTAHKDPFGRFANQGIRGLIGLVVMIVAVRMDYRRLSAWAPIIAIGSALLLLLVFLPGVGETSKGSQRWIGLGPVRFQPIELARLGLIIYLARLLSKPQARIARFTTGPLPAYLAAAVFMALIVIQPSLGSTLTLALTTLAMCLVAGMKRKHFLMTCLVGVVGLALVLVLKHDSYQVQRLMGFSKIWTNDPDRLGVTYQVRQSLIALGSGGMSGTGIGNSQQKRFFLPDAHTDFIYSIIGEELGFIGTMGVLALFVLLIGRGLRIATQAEDRFGFLLAAGLTMNFMIYAAINMGVTMALLPVTGLPLPFVSYGGSALIANLAAVGMLLSISRRCGTSYALIPARRHRKGLA